MAIATAGDADLVSVRPADTKADLFMLQVPPAPMLVCVTNATVWRVGSGHARVAAHPETILTLF
jgi:hypothetical protein